MLVGVIDAIPAQQPPALGGRKTLRSRRSAASPRRRNCSTSARERHRRRLELTPMEQINEAFERMEKGDVRYRFVIDMQTL